MGCQNKVVIKKQRIPLKDCDFFLVPKFGANQLIIVIIVYLKKAWLFGFNCCLG